MKYDLSGNEDVKRAADYLAKLSGQHAIVEIKKVNPKRSLNQNNYLHLLIGAFGAHFGYTMDEAKLIYKDLNANIYMYEKNRRKFYRSSADIDKEEMTRSIDNFRQWSDRAGYPLPPADDPGWLREIENAIETTRMYL